MPTHSEVLEKIFPNGTLDGDQISVSLLDVPSAPVWGTYKSSDMPDTLFYLVQLKDELVAVGAIQETDHSATVRIFKRADGPDAACKLHGIFEYYEMFQRITKDAVCFKQAMLDSQTYPSEELSF